MVSSTTTTLAGDAAFSSATRAMEVGVRDQLDARLVPRHRPASAPERILACPRGGSVDAGGRLPQRLEGGVDVGDHAGIDREIVGHARRRGFDLQHLAAGRERRAPYQTSSKNGPPTSSTRSFSANCLAMPGASKASVPR